MSDGDRLHRLSTGARQAIASRRASESLRATPTVRALMQTATPTGWLTLVISRAALASATPSALTVIVVVVAVLGVFAARLMLADLAFVGRLDRRLDRCASARNAAWLNGDALPRLGYLRPEAAVAPETMRRLDSPPLPLA